MGLIAETWRALLAPRRLFAILVIAVPLVVVQRELAVSPWALPVIVGAMLALLLISPVAYRSLLDPDRPRRTLLARLLLYGALGGLAPLLLHVLPRVLGLRAFVSTEPTVLVSIGLFWVAGYGLGRDIELELRWQAAHARAEALAKAAEHAQLLALRAQLDPHFLFNTLNAIAEWCREDAEVAERALLDLSAMLRQILGGVRSASWSLGEELSVVRRLLDLHRVRDPERFVIEWRVDPALEALAVPPLLLLPLAENAMTHGAARGHRGPVEVEATRSGSEVVVSIANPGRFAGRRPGGEGLATVERRLALAYGPRGRLDVAAEGERTRARVRWPASPHVEEA